MEKDQLKHETKVEREKAKDSLGTERGNAMPEADTATNKTLNPEIDPDDLDEDEQ